MIQNTIRIAAWLVLAFLVFATLSPIGWRPQSALPVNFERAAAFFVAGGLFGLAYPRQIVWIAAVMAVAIIALEWAQFLQPGRHGRELDAVVKLVGAGIGLGLGWWLSRLILRPMRR